MHAHETATNPAWHLCLACAPSDMTDSESRTLHSMHINCTLQASRCDLLQKPREAQLGCLLWRYAISHTAWVLDGPCMSADILGGQCLHTSWVPNEWTSVHTVAEGNYQIPPDDQQVVREHLLESMIRSAIDSGAGHMVIEHNRMMVSGDQVLSQTTRNCSQLYLPPGPPTWSSLSSGRS